MTKTAVLIWGRMNPPHAGHQHMVGIAKAYCRAAETQREQADLFIFLTHTVNKRNPLQYEQKIAYAKAAFGDCVVESKAKTIVEAIEHLEGRGYREIKIFVGADREEEMIGLAARLNKRKLQVTAYFKVATISVLAIDRRPRGRLGASATKMRKWAANFEILPFLASVPTKLLIWKGIKMFFQVRRGLREWT